MLNAAMLLHATSIAIDDCGVVLTGPSGIGKSDLALRLIDVGAALIADDQTQLTKTTVGLAASPPPALTGLLEIRHIGIVRLPYLQTAIVHLCVELTPDDCELERLPESQTILWLDHAVRQLRLPASAASTPAKIRAALKYPLDNSR
jgi:serine kinase of HPr protein (carbohydrate metabolism regulator)